MPRVGERGSYAWQQEASRRFYTTIAPHAGISLTCDDSERVQLSGLQLHARPGRAAARRARSQHLPSGSPTEHVGDVHHRDRRHAGTGELPRTTGIEPYRAGLRTRDRPRSTDFARSETRAEEAVMSEQEHDPTESAAEPEPDDTDQGGRGGPVEPRTSAADASLAQVRSGRGPRRAASSTHRRAPRGAR